jgi:hypothetical protein
VGAASGAVALVPELPPLIGLGLVVRVGLAAAVCGREWEEQAPTSSGARTTNARVPAARRAGVGFGGEPMQSYRSAGAP